MFEHGAGVEGGAGWGEETRSGERWEGAGGGGRGGGVISGCGSVHDGGEDWEL